MSKESYLIHGNTLEQLKNELKFILSKISTRLDTLDSSKDAISGYAGVSPADRIIKGVDCQDDLIIDITTKGLVLRDTQDPAHYWRVTVDFSGPVLVLTDLGTEKP